MQIRFFKYFIHDCNLSHFEFINFSEAFFTLPFLLYHSDQPLLSFRSSSKPKSLGRHLLNHFYRQVNIAKIPPTQQKRIKVPVCYHKNLKNPLCWKDHPRSAIEIWKIVNDKLKEKNSLMYPSPMCLCPAVTALRSLFHFFTFSSFFFTSQDFFFHSPFSNVLSKRIKIFKRLFCCIWSTSFNKI